MGSSGECAGLVDAIDWAKTSLGPRATRSPALSATVANILASRQPMLLFWGPELHQIYNDAFVPSFGRGKHPAAMGQPATTCWADAWPVVGAQIEAVMTKGDPAWFVDALVPIHRNGRLEEVYWTYSYSPAFEADGRIVGTLVIVTEMTARVLAGRRLAALSALSTAAGDAATRAEVMRAMDALAAANPADLPFVREVEAAFGEQPVPSPIAGASWPEPVERMFVIEVAADLRLGFGLSPRLPFDDGYRSFLLQIGEHLSAALRRIENADAVRAIVSSRDSLLMNAPIATALLTGPSHVYQLANPIYCRMAGRDPTGKSFAAAFPELVGDPVAQRLDEVFRTGAPFAATEHRSRMSREDLFVNYHFEPVRGADGNVAGVMIIAVDITAQVKASHAKDDFLAMLGHELRNPLAPIAAAVELMKRKDPASSREQATIERQLQHVTRLVDDLLDVSRITRGLIELRRQPVELATAVGRAVEMSRPLIEQGAHRLTVELAPGLVVDADEGRLTQIVSNLLTNAARYTPPGGDIRLTSTRQGDHAVLRVTDTGVGMEPELLARVFELFVQGKRSSDRAEGGLGLGLALVKRLVELHGGSVTATSGGRGAGSELTVTLPLATSTVADAVAATPARAAIPIATDARRVVIVDDNEDAAQLLGELLRTFGHEVETAYDPHSALRVIGEFNPDVAVLDIGLPGIDGYELAGMIRGRAHACRLVALTGYGQEADRARAMAAGFDGHLVKPVSLPALLQFIA
jgi:signal transduction histidine kinase